MRDISDNLTGVAVTEWLYFVIHYRLNRNYT